MDERRAWGAAREELLANLFALPHLQVKHAWLPLDSEALRGIRGLVHPENVMIQKWANAYRAIHRYNAMAAHANAYYANNPYGGLEASHGLIDEDVRRLVDELKDPLSEARDLVAVMLRELGVEDVAE